MEVLNVPPTATQEDVAKLFAEYNPVAVHVPGAEGAPLDKVVVVLPGMSDVGIAVMGMSRKVLGDRFIEVKPYNLMDVGFELLFLDSNDASLTVVPEELERSLREHLAEDSHSAEWVVKDVAVNSNMSAFLAFEGIGQV